MPFTVMPFTVVSEFIYLKQRTKQMTKYANKPIVKIKAEQMINLRDFNKFQKESKETGDDSQYAA